MKLNIYRMLCAGGLILTLSTASGQSATFGGQATLWIGGQASFYVGGNTTFNNTVTNNGTIISYNDVDFVANRQVGSLRFVGTGDQNLSGDTLEVVDLELDKNGNTNVVLLTDRVIVSGTLDVTSGVVQAEDELDLLVSGSSDDQGSGYVEGKLVGLSTGGSVTYPMGVNGSPNYMTLSNMNTGSIVRVECSVPDPAGLVPEDEVVELADEVEWTITALEDGTTDATVNISFSGVELQSVLDAQNSVYGEFIKANIYDPALLIKVPGDSLFRLIESDDITNTDNGLADEAPTSGSIFTSTPFTITSEPTRIVIGLIPVVDDIYFFVPNSFAPNGTFLENRTFRPFYSGAEVTSVSVQVYNSLNVEVYSFNLTEADIDLSLIGWDGRLPSGKPAPSGVYYYNVSILSPNGRESKAGSVLLVD